MIYLMVGHMVENNKTESKRKPSNKEVVCSKA